MPSEQLRQLGDVGRDAPRFIAREQIGRCASSGLGLEIDVSQRLTVVVAKQLHSCSSMSQGGGKRRGVVNLARPSPHSREAGDRLGVSNASRQAMP